MDLSLVNPYIRVAMPSVIPAFHHVARRIIYDYELIYLERGALTLFYDGMQYRCTAGNFIFIRPGIAHSFLLDAYEVSQPHIHFDITARLESEKIPVSFKDYGEMTDAEKRWIHPDYFSAYPAVPLVTVKEKAAFLSFFYRIVSGETDALTKKALMIRLLAVLIRENYPDLLEREVPLSVVSQVKSYIDAGNGLGESLADFSGHFHYNRFYLEKQFKAAFHVSLIAYRNGKRMEQAEKLLLSHPVSRVAEMLGFGSIYSFSRAYKKHFGVPPSRKSKQAGPATS